MGRYCVDKNISKHNIMAEDLILFPTIQQKIFIFLKLVLVTSVITVRISY